MEDEVSERSSKAPDSKEESASKPKDRKKQPVFPPSPRKVGEESDTLRRREEWFKKRQGRS